MAFSREPQIIFDSPVKVKRRTICKTDEAIVRRLRYNPRFAREKDGSLTKVRSEFEQYDGMVERQQKVSTFPDLSMAFSFKVNDLVHYSFSPAERMYHILKYMALWVANRAFPKNFLKARELRIFSKGSVEYAAMYSDFVPDGNGAKKRQMEARRLFYKTKNREERSKIRELADKKEHELTPGLAPLIEALSEAGIIVPHPEANYHLTENGIVFFEVSGIILQKALTEARRRFSDSKNLDLMEALAHMHAAIIRNAISAGYEHITKMSQSGALDNMSSAYLLPIYEKHMHLPFIVLQNMILLKYLALMEDSILHCDLVDILENMHTGNFSESTVFDIQ